MDGRQTTPVSESTLPPELIPTAWGPAHQKARSIEACPIAKKEGGWPVSRSLSDIRTQSRSFKANVPSSISTIEALYAVPLDECHSSIHCPHNKLIHHAVVMGTLECDGARGWIRANYFYSDAGFDLTTSVIIH
ncbi:hypothetical protein NPIL_452271 [Nephila pilipes]|uniref:Uncharacterized protein n=1 Tax=Nephila pilipes TaxID=299642 RepID=A0A8X6I9Y1_NEPPI|nr:hypothetical protein NPIL_452271 [Nephila pilipes]